MQDQGTTATVGIIILLGVTMTMGATVYFMLHDLPDWEVTMSNLQRSTNQTQPQNDTHPMNESETWYCHKLTYENETVKLCKTYPWDVNGTQEWQGDHKEPTMNATDPVGVGDPTQEPINTQEDPVESTTGTLNETTTEVSSTLG